VAAQERGERGVAANPKGIRGRAPQDTRQPRRGRLGLGGTSGPDRVPRLNSFTRQLPAPAHESNQNSTILLVNAS
jgi:hypothetical protein